MAKIATIFKKLVPNAVLDLLISQPAAADEDRVLWTGPFESWKKVEDNFGKYDSKEILEKCKISLLKVKHGEAAYERDSVLFDQIQYGWPLLASLQKAALENDGRLSVLDFGGSLGSSYFQNRTFLSSVKELSWSVVEQSHFVDCGKENFENTELKFYQTVEECLAENEIDVLLLSSVLQYLERPLDFLGDVLQHRFKYIVIDRTTFTGGMESKIMAQTVPESIYTAAYPCWFISEAEFKHAILGRYSILSDFDSFCDGPPQVFDQIPVSWKGFLLQSVS